MKTARLAHVPARNVRSWRCTEARRGGVGSPASNVQTRNRSVAGHDRAELLNIFRIDEGVLARNVAVRVRHPPASSHQDRAIAWSGDFVRRAARKARDVDHVLAQRRNAVRQCEPRASLPGVERQQGKAGDAPAATALPSPNPRSRPRKDRRGIRWTRRRVVQSKSHSPRQGRAIHR